MTTTYTLNYLASTYGAGNYNQNNYNGTNATSTGTSGTATNGGALSNTGVLAGLIVGVAAATLLIAMIVRIWRRPKQAVATQEAASDNSADK
jgi:hypothetical protein